ncbi:MAG: DUF3817 domain-containing protein [Deltaproteobacteria bacterium]|nr:DUF3817 domain-containing protein [Deltaproteobacteria bacterium]
MLRTDVGRFRMVSLLEGLSFLLLMGVAMPLKYLAHDPTLVRVMGRVHGGLFVLFVLALVQASLSASWKFPRVMTAMVASVLPFGAFWFEHQLRKEEAQA